MVIFLWHDMAFLLMSSFLDLFDFMKKTLNLKLFFWYLLRYLLWCFGLWVGCLYWEYNLKCRVFLIVGRRNYWISGANIQRSVTASAAILHFCCCAASYYTTFYPGKFSALLFQIQNPNQTSSAQLTTSEKIYNWSYCLVNWNQTRA